MQDFISNGSGNSRFLKSVSDFLTQYPTYEDMAAALAAGTLPVDFNGFNTNGVQQRGTPYNKASVLSDATAAKLGLDSSATPNDAFSTLYDLMGTTSLAVSAPGIQKGSAANAVGERSLAVGRGAWAPSDASYGIAVGASTRASYGSVSVGYNAYAGNNSIAIGYNATNHGANNEYGTSVGYDTHAYRHAIAIGPSASATMEYSIAIGENASTVYSQTAFHSIAIGSRSIAANGSSIAIGVAANASYRDGVAIGDGAIAGGASTAIGQGAYATGTSSVLVGGGYAKELYSAALGVSVNANSFYSTALGSRTTVTGNGSTAIGWLAATANDNSIQLGSATNLSSITAKVSITTTSDERDKTDIRAVDDGATEFLNKIRAIRYVWNGRILYQQEETRDENGKILNPLPQEERRLREKFGLGSYDREAHARGEKKGNRIRVGVSAQEVQSALESTFGDSSYANLVNDNLFDFRKDEIPAGVESQLSVNYEGFIPFLIKAVQELDGRLKAIGG